MLSPLIRQINSIVDSDARLQARMVRPRVRGDEAATQVSEKDVRRQSGKDDNRKQLERLRQDVNDSNGISLTDKATLNQALAELGTNLGVDPLAAALDIVADAESKLRKPELAEKYLMPYVKRIDRQQKKSKK